MTDLDFNDITAHLGLPLPHPDNDLEADVARLRDALIAIDGNLSALHTLLQSDDVDLDQLQELVNAVKANRSDIVTMLAGKANRDELTAVIADKASRAELAAVDAAKASKAELEAVAAAAFPPPAIRVNAYTELLPNRRYSLDSSAGPFSVMLPASHDGTWVWLRDVAGYCATNPVTVLRNGGLINNQDSDLLIDVAQDSAFLTNDANNWTD